MIDKSYFEEYAKLAVVNGVNIQKGQYLVINAPVEAYELVRECVKVAYEQGASCVEVNYSDEINTKLSFQKMSVEDLCEVPSYLVEKKKYQVDKKCAYLHIIGDDPDLLNDVNPEKVMKSSKARMEALKDFKYYTMNNVGQWSIVAYPNQSWAKKVFPEKNDDDAMTSLWNAILFTSRVEKGKTLNNWIKHNKEIQEHSKMMNDYNFKSLHFMNSEGTDLFVGLVKNHIWEGGCDKASSNNAIFNPNIPTEEVFTMPDRYHIDGKVVSTKPLSYNGQLINKFELTFKDGKVIDYHSNDNQEVLKNMLEIDEGSKSLGEVALISYDSPISKSNILFYETLFDENASCHLALGACYPTNIKDGTKMSRDELYKIGGNDSMQHIDFMFGSSDMNIIGLTYDNQEVVVFKDGNFVF